MDRTREAPFVDDCAVWTSHLSTDQFIRVMDTLIAEWEWTQALREYGVE